MKKLQPPAITVFTPTFNRAHTLPRLYVSLQQQTMKSFEWLIVDDGSSDGTRALVENWIAESRFPVRCFFQENAGKNVAFENGVREADAPLFAPIDSDDVALPTALEAYQREWTAIDKDQRGNFSGVSGLCVDDRGALIGTEYPQSPMVSDLSEIRFRWRVRGDKQGCYSTKVLAEFSFPEIEGAKFIPEDVLWSQIAKTYRHRFFNEYVQTVYIHESAGMRLSDVPDPATNARSHAFWHKGRLNDQVGWFTYHPVAFLRSAVHFVRFSMHDGVDLAQQFQFLTNWIARGLWLVAVPLGLMVYFRDKWRTGRQRRDPKSNNHVN